MDVATKELWVVVGLPFSGKTTFTKTIQPEKADVISRDAILESINHDNVLRQKLFFKAQTINQPESVLFSTTKENAWNDVVTEEYVRRVTEKVQKSEKEKVIVDGTHLSVASRRFIKNILDRKIIAIIMYTPKDVCLVRFRGAQLQGIRSTITEKLIERMDEVKVLPTLQEGFDEIRCE